MTMTLSTIDWIIIGSFFALSLGIGLLFKNRAQGGLKDFFLGGRKMPWLLAGVSMVATTFAADTPLAVTELVGKHGVSGNWLWWSFLAGGMLTTFFFAHLWHRSGVLTEVELIELRYSGKVAKFLRGFKAIYLGLFMNILIMAWVNLALLSILEVFFGIDRSEGLLYLLVAMGVAAFYAALSGIWGVAVTDAVQFVIAMTATIILAVLVLKEPAVGGIDGLKAQLPSWRFQFFPKIDSAASTGEALSLGIGAFLAYVSVQWWASWYPGAEPGGGGYVAQRFMSVKEPKKAVYATLFFQIAHYCLRPWPWILVALACLVLYPELNESNYQKGYVMAMRDFLPTGLKGLLLTAFFAAYMSTISTQLNWGSSYLINDVYKRYIKPEASSKNLVFNSRLITFVLMLLAVFITQFIDSIAGVWSFLIECGAGLGLVLILRWYYWRINAITELVATISPFVAFAISKFLLDLEFPQSFFFTVGFTTVSWIVAMVLSKPTNFETLKAFYEKVQPEGAWKPIQKISSVKKEKSSNLFIMTVAWLSAIIFCYSALFTFGSLIFKNSNEAIIYGAVSVFSCLILIRLIRRNNLWS